MQWERVMTKFGWSQTTHGAEPFTPLARLAEAARAEQRPISRVSMTVGTSAEFGSIKCSCTITVECPQDEGAISLAGEVVFMKALELVNDSANYLGIPTLPQPT
jgi:hypothetical protein